MRGVFFHNDCSFENTMGVVIICQNVIQVLFAFQNFFVAVELSPNFVAFFVEAAVFDDKFVQSAIQNLIARRGNDRLDFLFFGFPLFLRHFLPLALLGLCMRDLCDLGNLGDL